MSQLVGSDAAGDAQTAEVQFVIPDNSGLARLGLTVGDAEGLELLAGTLYNGPVRVASHNDCYFFHAILLKKIKMQIKKG